MKLLPRLLAFVLVVSLCTFGGTIPDIASAVPGAFLYVAPDGDDAHAGTITEPLATLAGARDKIRQFKDAASGALPTGGITVYFRDGTYQVEDTTYLTAEDSGTVSAPITYAAYPEETPLFTGGSYLPGSGFSKVTDPAMLSRLMTSDARRDVVAIDLFQNGFTFDDLDYSKAFWANGNLQEFVSDAYWETSYIPPRMQVFIDDQVLDLARYPNKVSGIFEENPYDSYLRFSEVLDTGFNEVTEQTTGNKPKFKTQDPRIKTWKSHEDIIVFGSLGWEFFYNKNIISEIDLNAHTIELKGEPGSGIRKGSRYAFENVFEELDAPGEYYISRDGKLYLYPTKEMSSTTVKITGLDQNYMVDVKDASHLTFSGLSFELTKGSVIHIAGGEHVKVNACTFKNFGGTGIRMGDSAWASRDLAHTYTELKEDGKTDEELNEMLSSGEWPFYEGNERAGGLHHSITGSTFINTGFPAARISVGSTANRIGGDMLFENNIIQHSGILGGAYNSGLYLDGVGMTIKNNLFAYCRGQAISANLVDTKIIYNEFLDSP
jgi:hypothetical protein